MNQDELVNRIQKSSALQEELASKSNNELADLVLEKIWADIELFTYNSELLDVVIERLRSGLTRRALDFAICAPEYHASLDEAGDRFCRMCGQPLIQ